MALSGQSFAPFHKDGGGEQQGRGGPQGTGAPIQEAIRVLNLRMPQVVGARALAPQALLNAPGAAGMPGGMNLEQLLRQLFGQLQPGAQVPGAPPMGPRGMAPGMAPAGASAPAPRVIPGVDTVPTGAPIPPPTPRLPSPTPSALPQPQQRPYDFSNIRTGMGPRGSMPGFRQG